MNRLRRASPSYRALAVSGIVLGLAFTLGAEKIRAASGVPREEPNQEPEKPEALSVRGLVIDATTRRGIARFRVIPGARLSYGVTWQPHLITTHKGGLFELTSLRLGDETQFRVEAEGYKPSVSRIVKNSEGPVKLRFVLEPDPGVFAVVRTPHGDPAAGAQAAWATLSREATAHGATITYSGHAESLGARVVTADGEGRLRLPPECDRGVIMVAHKSGYAEIKPADLMASGVVKLRRWCRVEGRVLSGTKPLAGQKVWVYRSGSATDGSPGPSWKDEAITGADGRFACDRLIEGRLVIDRVFSAGTDEICVNGLACFIDVREGKVTRVGLGGPGRTIVGRFEAPDHLGLPIDWSKTRIRLDLKAPHVGFPGDDQAWEIYRTFLNSEEGKAYSRDDLPVNGDGSFRIESVPPGTFHLGLWVTAPAVGRPSEPEVYYAVGHAQVEINAKLDEHSDQPQSVGTIRLGMLKRE